MSSGSEKIALNNGTQNVTYVESRPELNLVPLDLCVSGTRIASRSRPLMHILNQEPYSITAN